MHWTHRATIVIGIVVFAYAIYGIVSYETRKKESYTPQKFEVGVDKEPMKQSANYCDSSKMYSYTPLTVDYEYQPPSEENGCPCLDFVQPP